MSISFKNTKYHTFSPSGTTTKIAKQLKIQHLAIFCFYILVLCYVRYALIGLAYRRFRVCDDSNTMRREGSL